jgi:multidrug transporter EmrE-like cation transporter
LSTATVIPVVHPDGARRRSLILVFCCTLLGAAAQMFIKSGANHLSQPGFVGAVVGMLTNPMLFTGYFLYGVNTLLLAVALRDSELSLLYPVIALTYVWVSILSVTLLHETMNAMKFAGITAIVLGIGILGKGSRG